MLSLRSVDLLSNDLALAASACGHVKIGLVSVFDAHVDSLLLERDSVLDVAERADELPVDADEAHDQGRVEEGTDRHAPGHMVMLATVVSLAVVSFASVMTLAMVILSFKLVAALAFATFAALAMAALLSAFAVLAALSALLVKMTAAVALVNRGLRNVSQVEWLDSLGQSWEEHLFNAAAL